jgi:CYTH domain-containing protein
MGLEIERKFLVRKDLWYAVNKPDGIELRQSYLVNEPDKVIRIRTAGNSGFLTIKGPTQDATRLEYEYPVPILEAIEIFNHFTTKSIGKVRYKIEFDGKIWEIDEFFGDNEGLIIAEIELKSPDDLFERPSWIGEEVTSDPRYYNSYLIDHPYNSWK